MLGELAIAAARIGTFDWDLVTGTLTWDDQLKELFGYTDGDFSHTIESFNARVHPRDLPRVSQTIQQTVDAGGDLELEYRVVVPDGETRWVLSRGRALCDDSGAVVRLLGASYDTTSRQEEATRVSRVLEAMPTAFFSLDRGWRFRYVNAEAERFLARSRTELLGRVVWDLFPAALGSEFEENYTRAMAGDGPVSFDAHYPAPLDAWFEVRAWPDPEGLAVYFLDVTERKRAQAEAERAAGRAALMAQVTSDLAGTLDAEVAVARLAELVVPALADWCIVTLVDDEEHSPVRRRLRDIGWAHVDPAARPLAERYVALRLDALEDVSFLGRALESGAMQIVDDDAAARVSAVLRPGEARDLLGRLAPRTAVVLPLRGRGRTVGLISLFGSAERGGIDPQDLVTAQEVAARAGLALDNSRLYRQQRQVAEILQRSLLTEPAQPDHLQIVVRYVPAGEAAQVGGDWYDAFMQPDGATVLVIGDVVGHDITAAAVMGQVRSLVRGIAVTTGAGPAELLREVDRAMRTLQADTVVTGVVARIEQRDDERQRGITHIRWSNAGHPQPMAINPDGTVVVLSGVQNDLVLGIAPDSRRIESEIVLDRGTTVLLYTDGLVERRRRPLRTGMAELRDLLEELATLDLDALCDEVLARMLPDHPEDDVALVAVRLHRQDRLRPPEAGPNKVPPDVPDSPAIDPDAG